MDLPHTALFDVHPGRCFRCAHIRFAVCIFTSSPVAACQWLRDDLDTFPAAFSRWSTESPPNVTMHTHLTPLHTTRPPFLPPLISHSPWPHSSISLVLASFPIRRIFNRLFPTHSYGVSSVTKHDGKNLEMDGAPLQLGLLFPIPSGTDRQTLTSGARRCRCVTGVTVAQWQTRFGETLDGVNSHHLVVVNY